CADQICPCGIAAFRAQATKGRGDRLTTQLIELTIYALTLLGPDTRSWKFRACRRQNRAFPDDRSQCPRPALVDGPGRSRGGECGSVRGRGTVERRVPRGDALQQGPRVIGAPRQA